TPSAFPVAPPTAVSAPVDVTPPVNWAGASGRPNRLALYIGLSIAALGLICAAALVYHQRSKKKEQNKALAFGAPRQGGGRPTLSSAMAPGGNENRPRTQFRRGSLIVHIRQALGESVQKDPFPGTQSSGGGDPPSSNCELGSSPAAASGEPLPATSAATAPISRPEIVADLADDSPTTRSVDDDKIWQRSPGNAEEETAWRDSVLTLRVTAQGAARPLTGAVRVEGRARRSENNVEQQSTKRARKQSSEREREAERRELELLDGAEKAGQTGGFGKIGRQLKTDGAGPCGKLLFQIFHSKLQNSASEFQFSRASSSSLLLSFSFTLSVVRSALRL
ncbi:MAG: hypothetical protein BJ554DRAFT_6735, partial [Olpidium bornovanus]